MLCLYFPPNFRDSYSLHTRMPHITQSLGTEVNAILPEYCQWLHLKALPWNRHSEGKLVILDVPFSRLELLQKTLRTLHCALKWAWGHVIATTTVWTIQVNKRLRKVFPAHLSQFGINTSPFTEAFANNPKWDSAHSFLTKEKKKPKTHHIHLPIYLPVCWIFLDVLCQQGFSSKAGNRGS